MSATNATVAYVVPLQARWRRDVDRVEIRIGTGKPQGQTESIPTDAVVHIQDYQLLGVTVYDDKRLRLGRWLRERFPSTAYQAGEPVPPGSVVYHNGARAAYFSIWPRLGEEEELRLERTAWLVRDEQGDYVAVEIPVTAKGGRKDELGPAAGLLPKR